MQQLARQQQQQRAGAAGVSSMLAPSPQQALMRAVRRPFSTCSTSTSTSTGRAFSRTPSLRVAASGSDGSSAAGAAFAEGARVRVTSELKVFHVPKHADGLDLKGLQGTVKANVTEYKGKSLSANLPFRVQFEVEKDGAPVKFFAHLSDDEIEAA